MIIKFDNRLSDLYVGEEQGTMKVAENLTVKKNELRAIYFVLIVIVLFSGAFIFMQVVAPFSPTRVYNGSLFVSDAGQSHGGFEYTASWNATMRVVGTGGVLNLTLNMGLGDALNQHIFKVADFKVSSPDNISFKLGEFPVNMINVTHDEIWNGTYDNYYAACWGGYASSSEIIGNISPAAFPGLASYWYVELRMK